MIGFGEWSEPAYLLVAAAPDAPLKPVLQSVDESLISIVLPQSSSNNGAPITGY